MSGGWRTAAFTRERAPWLFAGPVLRLLDVLNADGEEARVVGGAVRNTLLGLPVSDIDLATTALPDVVMARVAAAGLHAVPTGIDHGTITVVINEKGYEVTTLRQDVETDGRHAVVRFGRDWKGDAGRRDFTINAMFVGGDGQVIDFTGGLEDIEAKRVRFIGDPATRIAEDYLRVLRFFRFHAAYGEGLPDAEGLAACIRAREQLGQLSRERVRNELLKLLFSEHAVPTLAVMSETGILVDVIAGVPWLSSFSNMIKAEARFGFEADATRRLGALAVRVREDGERLRERLRLTNEETRQLRSMTERWWQMSPGMSKADRRATLYRIGPEAYRDRALLAFSRADEKVDDGGWGDLIALPAKWTAPKFPLAAKDFVARGLEKGPMLGAALAAAEEAWVLGGFPEDAVSLDAIAARAVKESGDLAAAKKQNS
jgi:tRNA nucleotidyltransferase/poly(A) polymerase